MNSINRSAVAISPQRQPGAGARLVDYRPWPLPNPSLIGHATVDFNGWIVAKIPVFRRADGSLSIGGPNAPEIDSKGRARLRDDGKPAYFAIVSFAGADARERWQRVVLTALADAGVAP
jgi:hypothetical protein